MLRTAHNNILRKINPFKPPIINPASYAGTMKTLENFFEQERLQYCYVGNDMDQFSACEDSENIVVAELQGQSRAVMQTGQMALEKIIMGAREVKNIVDGMRDFGNVDDPEKKYRLERLAELGDPFAVNVLKDINILYVPNPMEIPRGYYCMNTSTRNESRAGDGRREFRFPITECEFAVETEESGLEELAQFLERMIVHLGFEKPARRYYTEECKIRGVKKLDDIDEADICNQAQNSVVLLMKFDEESDPYFNMRKNADGTFDKIDVLIDGVETVGSAVRSCNKDEMLDMLKKQDKGKYLTTMYKYFGEETIKNEVNDYFSYKFIPRCGLGIGTSRLIKALERHNLV